MADELKKYIKAVLKRMVPATFQKIDSAGNKYLNEIVEKNNKSSNELKEFMAGTQEYLSQLISENREFVYQHSIEILNQMSAIEVKLNKIEQSIQQNKAVLEQQLCDVQSQAFSCTEELRCLSKEYGILKQRMLEGDKERACEYENIGKVEREILWAHIFNNTIQNSAWLTEASFSPGRWAMGYPELYVLYRILDEAKPKSILELGLGQSTKMIAQYVKEDCDVRHYVVEHDRNWIEFYKNKNTVPANTQIIHLEREYISYKDEKQVRVFADFKKTFSDKTFDFIVIDAPLGSDMKHYSRIDILTILPQCLKENFVIVLDDAERSGEMNTIKEIDRVLKESQIGFKRSFYYGEKKICIWTALEWSFLCSM